MLQGSNRNINSDKVLKTCDMKATRLGSVEVRLLFVINRLIYVLCPRRVITQPNVNFSL